MKRSPEKTSKIMAAVKSKNTKPEIILRKSLWKSGYRFRVNYSKLPGKPDIILTKVKIAIFCDGDFWHGHNWFVRGFDNLDEELSRYSDYWKKKILTNIARDKKATAELENMNWLVLRFWESDIYNNINLCVQIIDDSYRNRMKLR